MSLYSVILCGGRGERFWPKSRRSLPKQFIALFGDESLTALTSRRMTRLSPMARQLFLAPEEFGPLLRRQLKLKKRNLLFEPYGRNTAPAIGIAAAYLHRLDPDATMAVLPADHLIRRQRDYESSMRLAAQLAQDGTLVTFGIPPTRPETGYGYVQAGAKVGGRGRLLAFRVRAFREKPDSATARRYLKAGNYFWNSGMFVWRADAILEEFRRHLPGFHAGLMRYADAVGTRREAAVLRDVYRDAPSISIDYGIMEKAENIAVVRATFEWDDVGSWLALGRHMHRDRAGNVLCGSCFTDGVQECIVDVDAGVVALLGVRDLVIVRSGDALLVAHRDRVGDIKGLLKRMAADPEAEAAL